LDQDSEHDSRNGLGIIHAKGVRSLARANLAMYRWLTGFAVMDYFCRAKPDYFSKAPKIVFMHGVEITAWPSINRAQYQRIGYGRDSKSKRSGNSTFQTLE
jgi:hypothetical protein